MRGMKMCLARRKLFKGRMMPGYWDLYIPGSGEPFDLREFVEDVESGKVKVDRDAVWYRVLEYDVRHGVYDKTVWKRLYYHAAMFWRNVKFCLNGTFHGKLFPSCSYPPNSHGGNEFIWFALILGCRFCTGRFGRMMGSISEMLDRVEEVYGSLL